MRSAEPWRCYWWWVLRLLLVLTQHSYLLCWFDVMTSDRLPYQCSSAKYFDHWCGKVFPGINWSIEYRMWHFNIGWCRTLLEIECCCEVIWWTYAQILKVMHNVIRGVSARVNDLCWGASEQYNSGRDLSFGRISDWMNHSDAGSGKIEQPKKKCQRSGDKSRPAQCRKQYYFY